jgi:hypothetical protein
VGDGRREGKCVLFERASDALGERTRARVVRRACVWCDERACVCVCVCVCCDIVIDHRLKEASYRERVCVLCGG